MKRSVVVLVACLMAIPLVGSAQRVRVTGTQGEVLGYGWEFDTAREGKASVALGREVIFLNEALTSASFRKDAEHTQRHKLFYSCMPCKVHRRVPGRCPCGQALVPSFKHGETWRTVGRDADGRLMVHGATARACHHGLAPAARKAGPCLEAKPRDKLGRCEKGEDCCRAKKVRKVIKRGACHEPKQCCRLERGVDAGECRRLEKGRKAGKCRKFRKVHKMLKCVEACMLGRGGADGKCDTLEQCRKEGKCCKIEKIRKMLRCIEARRCRRLKKCRAMGKTPQACRQDALRPEAAH